jgi:hypothetical protein
MLDGFQEEGFTGGVPMIPKPTSEAWLLCALKENPYEGCAALEDRSPKSLKDELRKLQGRLPTREDLCQMLVEKKMDIEQIDMPSFAPFRSRLEEAL